MALPAEGQQLNSKYNTDEGRVPILRRLEYQTRSVLRLAREVTCPVSAPMAQGHQGPLNNATPPVGYYKTQKMMAME